MAARKTIAKEDGKKKTTSKADKPKKPTSAKQSALAKQIKPAKEKTSKPTPSKKIRKGKDDTSANVVCDTPSPADAETGADTKKSNSEGDTKILNVTEEQGKDVSNTMALEERTVELDEGQAGSDPGKIPESQPLPERVLIEEDQAGSNSGQSHVVQAGLNPEPMHEDFVATVYPQVHESLKLTSEEQVHIENPLSSSETLSPMKNLDDAFTFGDQFLNDKPTKEEPGKANVETEVESMVTVSIHQASSSAPPLSTPIIDLTPPKPVSPTAQEPIFTATTTTTLPLPPPSPQQSTTVLEIATRVSALEKICANFEKRNKLQDKTTQDISSRVYMLENHDLSHPEHTTLYEALEASMDRKNREEFNEEMVKSRKRCRDDQDPPPPPPKYWLQNSLQFRNDVHLSDSEDTDVSHLLKIKTRPDWLKPLPEEEAPKTPEPDWIDLLNPKGNRLVHEISKPLPLRGPPGQVTIQTQYFFNKDLEYLVSGDKERRNALSISKLKAAYYPDFGLKELVPSLWIESERDYDISAAYNISHSYHIKILSVVSLKTFSKYGYTCLKEIILRRADYKEYKISEADFKNLHPNDFEDMHLLHLQGKLNHLSGADKVHLFKAFNLWIRNIVIRQRVEDLQLGIENYQTKLNLIQLSWDATDFLFKEDYTIFHKPRAVIYRDRNNHKKMMRETEVHKFSDGTLMRILEKLDVMVKDYVLFKFNPDMEHMIWSEDDKQRSQEFINLIERRLKIRRIFRSLESFISERLRDVDYRLIQITE
ncbi:hypothetical protein Tco_1115668 [Tanacetum coccineum]